MLTQEQKDEIRTLVESLMSRHEEEWKEEPSGELDRFGFLKLFAEPPSEPLVAEGEKHQIQAFVQKRPSESYVATLTQAIARAIEVLGSREKALRWLNTPLQSLDDKTPLALLDTEEGISRVETLLGQIEHGVW